MIQRDFGNVQIWKGTVQNRTEKIWDSDIPGTSNTDHVVNLQGDGNLIIWEIDASADDRKLLWKSDSPGEPGEYHFVLECEARGGGVAIYKGDKPGFGLTDNSVSVWHNVWEEEMSVDESESENAEASAAVGLLSSVGHLLLLLAGYWLCCIRL